MKSNYDLIASHYDFLSRLVFFNSQVKAQVQQLKYITGNSKILIVGGGTGWILEELAKRYETGLEITYVELSAKMLKLSEKRDFKNNKVYFIHQSIEGFRSDTVFDFILTPFLFDNFNKKQAEDIFMLLHSMLKDHGQWLFVDFFVSKGKSKWWNLLLLKAMYIFFTVLNIIEARKFTDVSSFFKNKGYSIIETRYYYKNFIKTAVYRK